MGWRSGSGWRSRRIPSYALTPPPTPKMSMATTRDQKKDSLPYPKGCFSSGGRAESRVPRRRSAVSPESTTEWIPSVSMAALPVQSAAMNLTVAIAMFARSAPMIVQRRPDFFFSCSATLYSRPRSRTRSMLLGSFEDAVAQERIDPRDHAPREQQTVMSLRHGEVSMAAGMRRFPDRDQRIAGLARKDQGSQDRTSVPREHADFPVARDRDRRAGRGG